MVESKTVRLHGLRFHSNQTVVQVGPVAMTFDVPSASVSLRVVCTAMTSSMLDNNYADTVKAPVSHSSRSLPRRLLTAESDKRGLWARRFCTFHH